MKIIGWTNWEDPRYKEIDFRFLNMEECDRIFRTVSDELSRRGYCFSGDYHQNGDYGVPILDDGRKVCVSCRNWGHIMANAHPNKIHDYELKYIHWAWFAPEKEIYPIPEDYI